MIFWACIYLFIGAVFAAYIILQEGLPSDWTDAVAVTLVVILAIVLWPWFVAMLVLDYFTKDKDIMKHF
jgi:hypothetical protein